VHRLIRVIRRRVFYQCDLVAELSGKANDAFGAVSSLLSPFGLQGE
jgi:hypothetical protein